MYLYVHICTYLYAYGIGIRIHNTYLNLRTYMYIHAQYILCTYVYTVHSVHTFHTVQYILHILYILHIVHVLHITYCTYFTSVHSVHIASTIHTYLPLIMQAIETGTFSHVRAFAFSSAQAFLNEFGIKSRGSILWCGSSGVLRNSSHLGSLANNPDQVAFNLHFRGHLSLNN